MKRTLVYESPITSLSEYGEHAREVASYLIKMEDVLDLHFVDSQKGPSQKSLKFNDPDITRIFNKQLTNDGVEEIYIYIKLGTPVEFNKVGKHNIGIGVIVESTLCHDSVLRGCNKMDQVVVSSKFNETTLVDSYAYHKIPTQTTLNIIPECVYYTSQPSDEGDIGVVAEFMDSVAEDFCYLYNGT